VRGSTACWSAGWLEGGENMAPAGYSLVWEMSTATRMTAEEYFAARDEYSRFTELIEGELVVDEPLLEHGLVQRNVLYELTSWARAKPGRGGAFPPIDVVIGEHNVFGPDVAWVPEELLPEPIGGRLEGLPALAVEVRSPTTWRYDIGKKKAAYERAGLPELWLVDTVALTVLVFRRSSKRAPGFDVELELSGADELASPLLPGFSVPVERLFSR
jgi:Uma2 family endonuclease